MEHEVYVPFSVSAVRGAFADPARVARCVPGLSLDDTGGAGARLRVRIGPTTITYRGVLALARRGEGFTIAGEGSEARGTGTASVLLIVVPRPVPDGSGTTLSFTATVEATGRLAACEPWQRQTTARRLLDRFAGALSEELERAGEQPPAPPAPPAPGGIGEPGDNERVIPGIPAPEGPQEREPVADRAEFDLEDLEDLEELDHLDKAEAAAEAEEAAAEPDLPAGFTRGRPAEPEADFARRTMIGRSAEEVDHAPPRGRYAPEPAPGRHSPARAETLRWAAPAAALALISAVVIGRRVLRRRR